MAQRNLDTSPVRSTTELPIVHDAVAFAALERELTSNGLGYILWGEFWRAIKPMVMPKPTQAEASAAAPAGSSSTPATAVATTTVPPTQALVKAAFDRVDTSGGGFIAPEAIDQLVKEIGTPHLPRL